MIVCDRCGDEVPWGDEDRSWTAVCDVSSADTLMTVHNHSRDGNGDDLEGAVAELCSDCTFEAVGWFSKFIRQGKKDGDDV